MNERLKDLRKTLNLSQDAFGERIGMSGGAISLLEKGKRNVTEQVVKSICREYSVDYMWLTTGDGEMFVESDDDFMEKIDRIMAGENDARKNMIKTLLNASDADIEALDNLIDYYIELRGNKEKD
jgi:transcriptional regulator with XRE-family HTH domain